MGGRYTSGDNGVIDEAIAFDTPVQLPLSEFHPISTYS